MSRDIPTSDEILELLLSREGDGSSLSFDREQLLDALEALHPDELTVINGVFWEGISARSIAREHGWSRARVAALQRSALATLAVKLA